MKKLTALLLALVLVFSLAACGGGSDDQPSDTATPSPTPTTSDGGGTEATNPPVSEDGPTYGGTLTIQYGDFNTVFDPAMGEQYVYSLWFEYLFTMDWGLNDPSVYSFQENVFALDYATGQIAKEWDWNADAMQFTVTIRDDIYFQEKEPEYDVFGARNLVAEDVKYSYDRLVGTGSGFDETNYVAVDADWRMRMNMLESIEVTDTYTLVFQLNTASETKLSEMIIAQVNIIGPEWDTLSEAQRNDWRYACGTGPYILTEYVPDNHYTFVRNDNYYGYDERYPENKLPYLDSIVLQKYGDSTSVISNFISGDLDYVYINAGLSDSEKEQLLKNVTDCAVQTFPYAASGISFKMNHEPFSDLNVRIAMQKAINLEEINSAYFGYDEFRHSSLWAPTLTSFSSVSQWDDELLDEFSYDPEAAKQLLADAGYPDGFEFTIAVGPTSDVNVYQLAKSYLADVGITMNIEVLADMMSGREISSNPDDPRASGGDRGSATDAGFAFQTFATTGFAYSLYHEDTHMDDLLIATRDAMTIKEQEEAARAADLYFAQQHWNVAVTGQTYRSAFVSSSLGGLENGELLNASHFLKTIVARIWEK